MILTSFSISRTNLIAQTIRINECINQERNPRKMNSKQKTILAISALVVTAATTISQGRPDKNLSSPEPQKAVLIRLDEIQKAAEGRDPDKVFSFVLENDAGALAQNGRLF